jgi:hypothetical protein
MDTEKIQIIDQIVDDKPVRLRETYFSKNHIDIYDSIMKFTNNLDLPFIQRVWHWVNNFDKYFTCDCGNKTSFNRNWLDGYKLNCSAKCAQVKQSTKEKRKQTTIQKWGVDNVAKSEIVKEITEKSNIQKWGYKSTFQNEEVRSKWKKNIEEKWGVDHYFKTEEFKAKTKIYYLQKWGVTHQLMIDDVKDRIKKTCLERYGVETYLNTKHSRESIKSYNRSSYEDEISDWLKSLGIEVINSERNFINPQILDIYLPQYKIAIEFNGLYWHSEFKKDKFYHLNKTLKCKENGIDLIHIWEDDWLNRKDVLKSIIINKIGKTENKIYARNCQIVELNNTETSVFLNDNHIQGYCRYNKSFGLKFDEQLVSVMTFGYRSTNSKKEYELIRYCNKNNLHVVGSASKLFKHFISKFDVDNISTYADISIFKGGVYEKIGFKFLHRSPPNYWWVVGGVRKHRFNYNKKKLVKMGHDPLKTEVEIMHGLNNYRIWGCGQEKWIWLRSDS